MYSPWGMVQDKTTVMRGVHLIGTAGHGGFMISKGTMQKFHPALVKCSVYGRSYGNYICFEEDVESCAVFLELMELGYTPEQMKLNVDITKEDLIKQLSSGNTYKEYLRLRGFLTEDGLLNTIQAAKDMGMLQIVHVTA